MVDALFIGEIVVERKEAQGVIIADCFEISLLDTIMDT